MYRQNKNRTVSNIEMNHVSNMNKNCFPVKTKEIQITSMCVVMYYKYFFKSKTMKCFSSVFKR